MKNVIELIEKVNVVAVDDKKVKFDLETLRSYQHEGSNRTIIELRHTKTNLIEVDGQICKARKIETFPSGSCQLWFSYPKGKSFSQNSYAIDVNINKSPHM